MTSHITTPHTSVTNTGPTEQANTVGTNQTLAGNVHAPQTQGLPHATDNSKTHKPQLLEAHTVGLATGLLTDNPQTVGSMKAEPKSALGTEGKVWGSGDGTGRPKPYEDMIHLPGDTRAQMQSDVEADRNGQRVWQTKSDKQNFIHNKFPNDNYHNTPDFTAVMKHADVDRLKQANTEQSAFVRKLEQRECFKTDGVYEPEGPHVYDTKESFDREARDLLIGRDAGNTPISKREELERGWALFNNARNAKPFDDGETKIDKFIVFGRTPDVNHTGAGKLGYTSEYNNGAVLMPERWNYFMNTCWVMGGIKGDATFVSGTSFERMSRTEVAQKESLRQMQMKPMEQQIGQDKVEDDFRSDWTEDLKNGDPLLHYTITVSVSELTALQAFGYHAEPHDKFGVILVPGKSKEDMEARQNASFTEFQSKLNEARVGMAMENLSGDDFISPGLQDFIMQADRSSTQVTLVKDFVGSITDDTKDLSVNEKTNYLVRKVDIKMDQALKRVAEEMQSGDRTSPKVLGARQELTMSVKLATDHAVEGLGLDATKKDLVDLDMLRELGSRFDKGESAIVWKNFGDIGKDATAVAQNVDALKGTDVERLKQQLDTVKSDFLKTVTDTGRADASLPRSGTEAKYGKDEGDALFAAFRREMALELGATGALPDVAGRVGAFLANYDYAYGR